DSPAALVIEEGKFAERNRFPAKVTFNLPAEITRLTDVCSLSPGGHHFCQLFELKSGVDHTFIDIRLPYADFFIDYQYAPFTVLPDSVRSFTYLMQPNYAVARLEAHVQVPSGSSDFAVAPDGERYEKEGFVYRKLVFENVKAGERIPLAISYYKAGVNPSVEEKFSAMKTPEIFDGATGEWLLGVGMAALAFFWLVRRRRGGWAP
ncbi:MAG: hypothetical protein HQK87_10865, partial [Nitrospinae bacterium]|nr:hypothetical protein [Nitrospinota bacterium]